MQKGPEPQPPDTNSECLFLLEILIDKIIFLKTPCFSDQNFRTSVNFEFLTGMMLEISDTEGAKGSASGPYLKEFNSGKSCLFALKPNDMDAAMSEFAIKVSVYKCLPCDCLPSKMFIGNCNLVMTKQFTQARNMYLKAPDKVSSQSLKDAFRLKAADGTDTGDLLLFVRISCFGKNIITKFQGSDPMTSKSIEVGKGCSPNKTYKSIGDDCSCSTNLYRGPVDPPCTQSGCCGQEPAPDEPACSCLGKKPPASILQNAACRNTEQYCLHVPKGGKADDELGRVAKHINGTDIRIKIPKDQASVKEGRYGQDYTVMRCEHDSCNQSQYVPQPRQGCGHGVRCSNVSKHGFGGCNLVPRNVPEPEECTQKIHPNKDVFVFRVQKIRSDGEKKTKMEMELITPKGWQKKRNTRLDSRYSQCDPEKKANKKPKSTKKCDLSNA